MSDDQQLTPLMEQYFSVKKQYPEDVLFFRVGDFYEMFGSDAVEVSRLINLTLTHRGASPMCGVPYHASKIYIARLLRLGKKIAICEQIGPISPSGGLTERKVIEVITPGTAVESEYLDGGTNNFLASLSVSHGKAGFAFIDVTTGEFRCTSWQASSMAENFSKEIGRVLPRELILPLSLKENQDIQNGIQGIPSISVSYYPDWHFNAETSYKRLIQQFKTANLNSFMLNENSSELAPAGFLLDYLEKTTGTEVPHIKSISVYHDSEYVIIDDSSRRNLEIVSNLRDGSAQYSLLECVNYTLTAMGNRTLRSWMLSPLTDIKKIEGRQEQVTLFFKDSELQKNVRDSLSPILDIERLAARIAMDKAHAKDLQALKASLVSWRTVRSFLAKCILISSASEEADFIINLIENSILDDPSTLLTEGRLIKDGWSKELDHYREIENNFNQILDDYLEEEKEKTGIPNLKIKHNSASGYVLEVTKGKLSFVPDHFILRRSLLNTERYTTEKLKSLEKELTEASSNIIETEKSLFLEIRTKLKEYVPYLIQTAKEIAYIDVTSSLAHAATVHRWVCPEINESVAFNIEGGRHPVVELHLPSGEFVKNSLSLKGNDGENSSINNISFALITGPNMAGKSTFLRQNALIVLLSQIGSYVPADKAEIGIVDKIFCRVGASDNLARGESTFLVEMSETARILNSSTNRSFVIMDEVGRGTSTEDGLSIAWAVSEYLLENIKCRTLFATHYHELTRLENKNMQLLCMEVSEKNGAVIFLRKIKQGASENSYGIHVARLAGIPDSVISRANVILNHIQGLAANRPIQVSSSGSKTETAALEIRTAAPKTEETPEKTFSSPGLFSDEEIILDEILSSEVDNMTPLLALQTIARWKKLLSGK